MSLITLCLVALLLGMNVSCAQRSITPEKYNTLMSEALKNIQSRTRSSGPPPEFSLNLFMAHEAWIGAMPQDALLKAVDAFKEAGVQRVDINMGPYPWIDGDKDAIKKYDAVIDRIRKAGLKLQINPQFSPVRHRYSSLAKWEAAATTFFPEIARRYRPDTFVVVHEPTTMATRMGITVSPAEWANFAQKLARLVKSSSPGTRIGAGGLHTEQEYFKAFASLKDIDVLTLDIYNLSALNTFNNMIKIAQQYNKPVYIEETWRPPYFTPRIGQTLETVSMQNVGNRKFAELDVEWMEMITDYAHANGLEAVTFVWMQPFFKYVDDDGDINNKAYNIAVVEAIMRGERTATFRALQQIILSKRGSGNI